MKNNESNGSILGQKSPWMHNENTIWLATTMGFHRNLEKFNFPTKLDTERKKQLLNLVSKELLNASGLSAPEYYKAEAMSPLEKEFLGEHSFSNLGFHQAQAGEAFVVDQTGDFLACLNLRNHLYLQYMDCTGELESTWNKLVRVETQVGKVINYAFSPRFGYLTADIGDCGTGLTVSLLLQLSALIHTDKIDDLLDVLADENYNITGMSGSPTEVIGDVLSIQNNYSLGISEETIISSLRNFATKIMVEESAERSRLRQEGTPDVKDKVSRAFGVLIHSYQIETVEALDAISLLKFGVDLGWVKGIDIPTLNHLFFTCRRAHLLNSLGEKSSANQEDLLHKRAEFIHRSLKNVALTFE